MTLTDYTLRPNGDSKAQWVEVPASTAYTALDDTAVDPATPDTSDYAKTVGDAQIMKLDLTSFTLGASEAVFSQAVHTYAETGAGSGVTISLQGGAVLDTFPASTAASWRQSSALGGLSQAEVDALQLQYQPDGNNTAPTYQSDGGSIQCNASNNTAVSVTLPATRPAGSVLLLVTWCRLITASPTLGGSTSFTLLDNFPITSGTASGGRIYVYARVVDGTESAPTVTWSGSATGTTGDWWGACMYCYSGVDTSGGIQGIVDGTPQPTDAAGTTTCTYAAISTNQVNDRVLRFLCRFRDAADTFTPTGSPAHTEREDFGSTTRTGGQHHFQELDSASTGSNASVTVAPSNTTSSRYLSVSMALKAQPHIVYSGYVVLTTTQPTSKTVGVVGSTAVAQPLTVVKPIVKTVGSVVSTTAAQPLTVVKPIVKTIGAAASSTAAQLLDYAVQAGAQTFDWNGAAGTPQTAASSTAAQPLTVTKPIYVTVGAAAAATAVQPLTVAHAITVGPASSSSAAQPVTATKPIVRTLGVAVSSSAAQPVAAAHAATVGPASTSTAAQTATPTKAVTLATAVAATEAQALTTAGIQHKVLGAALNTTTAQPLVVTKPIFVSLGVAAASTGALAATPSKRVGVGVVTTSTAGEALSITHPISVTVGVAAAVTVAQPLTVVVAAGAPPLDMPLTLRLDPHVRTATIAGRANTVRLEPHPRGLGVAERTNQTRVEPHDRTTELDPHERTLEVDG